VRSMFACVCVSTRGMSRLATISRTSSSTSTLGKDVVVVVVVVVVVSPTDAQTFESKVVPSPPPPPPPPPPEKLINSNGTNESCIRLQHGHDILRYPPPTPSEGEEGIRNDGSTRRFVNEYRSADVVSSFMVVGGRREGEIRRGRSRI